MAVFSEYVTSSSKGPAPYPSPSLTEALPFWEGNGSLASPLYKDSYFSRSGAMAESRHIFLQQNRLPHRWLEKKDFHVCETGFGTGLNFLLCTELWRRFAPFDGFLHYTSVEKHPIPRSHLQEIHRAWPPLAAFSQPLLEHYPPSQAGRHSLFFPDWRIRLDLILDEAARLASYLPKKVDAWFLDGFAPEANPDMWSESLFDTMDAWTAEGGTFATFTAAGFVRRALTKIGFDVERVPGFSGKREMLRGKR